MAHWYSKKYKDYVAIKKPVHLLQQAFLLVFTIILSWLWFNVAYANERYNSH